MNFLGKTMDEKGMIVANAVVENLSKDVSTNQLSILYVILSCFYLKVWHIWKTESGLLYDNPNFQ